MNSSCKYYFSYEKTNTEPNDNFKKDKVLYNDYKHNLNKNSQIKKEYTINKSIDNSNLMIHNFLKKNNSFSYNAKQDNLLLKKKNQKKNNSINLFENSLILNNNKSYFLKNEKSPLIYKTKNDDNSFNLNLPNGFKINNILKNKNRNNKLKIKFENLLDLAFKNYNDNKKNLNKLENKFEIKNMAKLEMIIDKIRNKNRKEIFKKQMELNILCKRNINNNNIEQIKEKLNKKLNEQLNKSNLYKSINYNNNDYSKNKRNKSFKNSFIYLNDIKYNNNNLKRNNSYKLILKTQNIYRPNSKLDYNKKIIENEKNEIDGRKNEIKFKNKMKFLRTDLSFF